MKTTLTVLLLAGATGFVLHTLKEQERTTTMPEVIEETTPPIELATITPPVVNFAEIRAHRRNFADYANQIEDDTARVYDQLNTKDKPWYQDGLTAARVFGGFAATGDYYAEGLFYTARFYAQSAYKKGCRDPLILSIIDTYRYKKFYSTTVEEANRHLDNLKALSATQYPVVVKLEADIAGFEDLVYMKKKAPDALAPALDRMPQLYVQTLADLQALLKSNAPDPITYSVLADFYDSLQDDPVTLIKAGPDTEALLKQSKMSPALQAACQGDYLVTLAWSSRGSGWASTVAPAGWKGMEAALEQAERIVSKASDKYPTEIRLPTLMLTIELGQGRGTYRMNNWFAKARAIDPYYYRAWSAKGYYLQPKWYGTAKECLEFGRECVRTGQWDKLIPLVFVDNVATMAKQAPDIYKNEELWQAVSSAYEEYLKRYPRSLCYRTNYLNAAALAGKWDTVKQQLDLLGGHWEELAVSRKRMNEIRAQLAAAKPS